MAVRCGSRGGRAVGRTDGRRTAKIVVMAASREEEIRARLGRVSFGGGRDIRGVAALIGDEELRAAVVVWWRRRGWVAVATDQCLRLSWRSAILGRPADVRFDWSELEHVEAHGFATRLQFGGQRLTMLGPPSEEARLVDTARRAKGADVASAVELRGLARRKLGRFLAATHDPDFMMLPERLQPEERVERLAIAELHFPGLLVLTDRRLILMNAGAEDDGWWEVPRTDIALAEPVSDDLRMVVAGREVVLRKLMPPDRLAEFAVAVPH